MVDFLALETLLPFLLVLAIVYGAMDTAKMFRNRALKTIISVVMAFFAISDASVVAMLNSMLPYAAIFFILIFVAGYVRRSLGGEGQKDNTIVIIIIVLALLLIAAYARAEGGMYEYSEFFWFVGIIAIISILYAAYKMK
ncbi:MAG: hypothetical protein JXC85_02810 [Candidatus Aenigmarchaeota archaeon]|nr:hypothetical protein [Candidatus Aenigmarchaeota archaeon]